METNGCDRTTDEVPRGLLPGAQERLLETGIAAAPGSGRRFPVASEEWRFQRGDLLVVQTDRGDLLMRARDASRRTLVASGRHLRVVRRLGPREGQTLLDRTTAREQEARGVFVQAVRRRDLEMHLSEVEVYLDNRVAFLFTAPERVDFRELVRELAQTLKTRVELRQVGVRDETRCTGGLGPCGLPVCCASFLRDFTTVSIRMAKTQGLVPNPQKVSGLCGRLMCCLAYEQPWYVEAMKGFPKMNSMVTTPKGEGKVKELLILKGAVRVSLGPGMFEEFPLDKVSWKRGGAGAGASGTTPEEADDAADDDGDAS
ncbi:MAG TPA: regulatory iron-sulfur-containing complex subunit RicT [Myxococcota bacterium]|nr:regulatory iron-sulfur-containing complex subunit RicT [Myxococcota bacterium]HQK51978.1 regulatory iron-sulfur-containing complex subunit RicT [Myxococcota bacterium]